MADPGVPGAAEGSRLPLSRLAHLFARTSDRPPCVELMTAKPGGPASGPMAGSVRRTAVFLPRPGEGLGRAHRMAAFLRLNGENLSTGSDRLRGVELNASRARREGGAGRAEREGPDRTGGAGPGRDRGRRTGQGELGRRT